VWLRSSQERTLVDVVVIVDLVVDGDGDGDGCAHRRGEERDRGLIDSA
jgi:hypothetical protein